MASHGVTILGSTGSVGRSTLDVIARHPQRFHVVALTAHRNTRLLAEQCHRHQARYAVVSEADRADELQARLRELDCAAQVMAGPTGLEAVVELEETTSVMAAIVGAAGLAPALHAARCGKRLLLANKESMVIAGALFARAVAEHGAVVIPVDSEHNALFQALPDEHKGDLQAAGVEQLILTASGGPFLDTEPEALDKVTPEQACKHPNWDMGRKISVDSATLMNKGLEAIEAHHLFGLSMERVEVVVHPRSIVHGIVEFVDGSCIVQASRPDMRLPIQLALGWPERLADGAEPLDWPSLGALAFEPVDHEAFPALELAYDAARRGGTCPAVLNAANEEAVEAFLEQRIAYLDIVEIVRDVLAEHRPGGPPTLDSVLDAERWARAAARAKADA